MRREAKPEAPSRSLPPHSATGAGLQFLVEVRKTLWTSVELLIKRGVRPESMRVAENDMGT